MLVPTVAFTKIINDDRDLEEISSILSPYFGLYELVETRSVEGKPFDDPSDFECSPKINIEDTGYDEIETGGPILSPAYAGLGLKPLIRLQCPFAYKHCFYRSISFSESITGLRVKDDGRGFTAFEKPTISSNIFFKFLLSYQRKMDWSFSEDLQELELRSEVSVVNAFDNKHPFPKKGKLVCTYKKTSV